MSERQTYYDAGRATIMAKGKAGLITFVKDQCANFSTSGDCVYGKPCLVVDGKPCGYFERSVLGPADYRYRVPGYDYAGLFAAYGQINLSFQGRAHKVVGRYCGCGAILRPRERFCPDCRRRNRQKSYRAKRGRLNCLTRHS